MSRNNLISPSDVVAIILVGGLGERLGGLTFYRAKPAVMIGGNAIASFSSSNALNSGVENVVIASQYLPYSLKRFYSRIYGAEYGPGKRIDVIDPNDTIADAARYRGTADALYQALQIAKRLKKEFVLVLSGDHIYQFDFTGLFNQFYQKYDNDSFVVLSQKVARQDAPRFGIFQTQQGSTRIINWIEKPKEHELLLGQNEFDAGLGIYFGRADLMEKILKVQQEMRRRGNMGDDVGKDVIPYLVDNPNLAMVHSFNMPNFWADVGEPKALFGAARSIYIEKSPDIIGNLDWKIAGLGIPTFIHKNGVRYFECGDLVSGGSAINNSIFSPGVIADRASIEECILMGETEGVLSHIHYGAELYRVIFDKAAQSGHHAVVRAGDNGLVVVVRGTHIQPRVIIEAKSDAIVAELKELELFSNRITKIAEKGNLQLFLPDGTEVSLDEILRRE